MESAVTRSATLVRYPDDHDCPVRGIRARACRDRDGLLPISYVIEGAISRVRMPASSSPRFVDGLWKHTCCECFIAVDGEPGYHEFNLSPSGEWAAYGFADYRNGGPLTDGMLSPQISVTTVAEKIQLDAVVALERLSPRYSGATLRLGLSAVIEDTNGVLSYWALRHLQDKPDFHDKRSFVLEMAPHPGASP
jgi:hypothetical protein